MNILVIGGTRFFGIPMIEELLKSGHDVTIATRGLSADSFGSRVKRLILDRADAQSVRNALSGRHFDVIIDKLAYCSNDIKSVMDAADFDRYIQMSTTAVYDPKHINTMESDFDALAKELVWCGRQDFPYAEIKRQAECALWQQYPDRNWIAVRYPFVIGRDDYTRRLLFYVDHVIHSRPMHIDNADHQMSFIRSDEAGKFLAFLAEKDCRGAVNGASEGTVSVREILDYVEQKTGKQAVIEAVGDPAPYNGEPEYSINTDKAAALGFRFSRLRDWIYDLLDYYIAGLTHQ